MIRPPCKVPFCMANNSSTRLVCSNETPGQALTPHSNSSHGGSMFHEH